MEYKNVDNDENIVHYLKNLSILADNDYILRSESFYIEFKKFHTSIGHLYSSKSRLIINTLADNTLQYHIIPSDEIITFVTPAFFIYNLSTNS